MSQPDPKQTYCQVCPVLRRRIQRLESELIRAKRPAPDSWAGPDRQREAAERDRAMEAAQMAQERFEAGNVANHESEPIVLARGEHNAGRGGLE